MWKIWMFQQCHLNQFKIANTHLRIYLLQLKKYFWYFYFFESKIQQRSRYCSSPKWLRFIVASRILFSERTRTHSSTVREKRGWERAEWNIEWGSCARSNYETNAPKMIAHWSRLTGELIIRCVRICSVILIRARAPTRSTWLKSFNSTKSLWMNLNERKWEKWNKTNKRSVGFSSTNSSQLNGAGMPCQELI